MGKIFTKRLDKDDKVDKKEGLFKRMKNIKDNVKMKNNQNQLKINQTQLIKIPKEIVLLKDRLDNIFENFGLNLNST